MSEPLDLEAMEREWDAYGERPDGDAVLAMFAEIRGLRSKLSQVTRERDEAREEAARVRLLGESDSRELLKAETSRDAAEATLREAREAWKRADLHHWTGPPKFGPFMCKALAGGDCDCGLESVARIRAAEAERDEALAQLERARAAVDAWWPTVYYPPTAVERAVRAALAPGAGS